MTEYRSIDLVQGVPFDQCAHPVTETPLGGLLDASKVRVWEVPASQYKRSMFMEPVLIKSLNRDPGCSSNESAHKGVD